MSDTIAQPGTNLIRDPMPELRRIVSARALRGEPPAVAVDGGIAEMLSPWADEGAVCPPPWFEADGDAVLLLGDWTGPTEGDAALLRTTLAGLALEGVIRSARCCREGGLLVAVCDSRLRPSEGGAAGKLLGVAVHPAAADPAPPLESQLFGEAPNRVVVSVRGEDAGRVLKQAKILGVPAVRVGTVGGDTLVVRYGEQEWREPLG